MRLWMASVPWVVACETDPDPTDPGDAMVAEVDCTGAPIAQTVEMIDITFQPSEVQVRVGEVVEFVNRTVQGVVEVQQAEGG